MSHEAKDERGATTPGANGLLAQIAGAEAVLRARRKAAIDDFRMPADARIDDRSRGAIETLLRTIVGTIGGDIQRHALRVPDQDGANADAAEARQAIEAVSAVRVIEIAVPMLLDDTDVSAAVLVRVAVDWLASALSPASFDLGDAPDPLRALTESGDGAITRRLTALVAAEARRHGPVDQPPYATDLEAETQVRCTWIVAAAMAASLNGGVARGRAEAAIVEGAGRALAQYDEGERLEAQAVRFAATIDVRGDAMGDMVQHGWAQGRVVLGAALLAHAGRVALDDMIDMVVDPDATRLALYGRAIGLSRTTMARLGYALAEADSRRDLEVLADMIDAVSALPGDVADALLHDMRLPKGYRDARSALAGGAR